MAYQKNDDAAVRTHEEDTAPIEATVIVQHRQPAKRQLKDYSPSLQNAARALWGVNREVR